MITFHILSLFPDVVGAYLDASILGRAQKNKLFSVKTWQIRDFANNKHHTTDLRPYGGGPGMVMKAEPILRAVKKAVGGKRNKKAEIIVFSAQGKQFTQSDATKLSKSKNQIVLICGRYEGIDARVTKILRAKEYSVGPYTLTGGEVPAMLVVDSVARHIPGVLGKFSSREEGRAASKEVYTRPETFTWKGKRYKVPKILLTGHHANMEEWRKKRSNRL